MEGVEGFEQYLREARVLYETDFSTGTAHPSKLLVLEGGVGVIAKTEANQPQPGMIEWEVAAWEIMKALGWTDLMSATVLRTIERDGDEIRTSVTVAWPSNRPDAPPDQFPEHDVWRAAIFDVLVNQQDRGGHNWLAVPDPASGGEPRLKLIDHGYAFGDGGLGSTFFEMCDGQDIPQELLEDLRALLGAWPTPGLSDLLPEDVVSKLRERAQRLLDAGALSAVG
jgi:hypothetical protein